MERTWTICVSTWLSYDHRNKLWAPGVSPNQDCCASQELSECPIVKAREINAALGAVTLTAYFSTLPPIELTTVNMYRSFY